MLNSIIIIVSILVIVYFSIKPLDLKFFKLDILSTPLIVLLLLLVFRVINFEIIINGLKGYQNIKPLEIMVIFYTVSYVSISVDLSGILDYFAFRIVRFAKNSGFLLFVFFYLFSSLLTIFTSNDIVILTLTPIIFYLSKHSNINIIPLLFAEFFGANTASMFFYIGNPTNIIIGNAMNLNFFEYSKVMFFPTLVAVISNFVILFLIFRKSILVNYELKIDSKSSIRDPYDVVVSSLLLVLMLIFLFLSSKIGLPIWKITLIFFVIYLIEDILIGSFYTFKHLNLYITEISKDIKNIFSIYGISNTPHHTFSSHKHDFFTIIKRLPWKIFNFVLVIFILVYALYYYHFIDLVSQLISKVSSKNMFLSIFTNGTISIILTNILNNQPMSILYSYIMTCSGFLKENLAGSIYSSIIASNLGANLTLIGALAGLMWENILSEKGVKISYKNFLKIGLIVTPITFYLSLLTLWLILRN